MAPREVQTGLLKYQPLEGTSQSVYERALSEKAEPSEISKMAEDLVREDTEKFFNFASAIIKLGNVEYSSLILDYLFSTSKKDLRGLRLLFIGATEKNATSKAKTYLLESLQIQKRQLRDNLFVDLLIEISTSDSSLISHELMLDLVRGLNDPRIPNLIEAQ